MRGAQHRVLRLLAQLLNNGLRAAPRAIAIGMVAAGFSAAPVRAQTNPAAAPVANLVVPDPPIVCSQCDRWSTPHEPFKVYGNTYYVGTNALSSVLIATKGGLILLDGTLTQNAPQIEASIRKLGFRLEDVKLIVNSHTHFDHAAGIAALQRASKAEVAASPAAARALEQGGPVPEDPQYGFAPDNLFPAVKSVRVIRNGQPLKLGDVMIVPRFTPGHTPGGTTWTWKSCEGNRCLNMVYVDSLTPVAAPGFRYTGDATHPSIVKTYRRSIATVRGLSCDILIAPHPELIALEEKYQKLKAGAVPNPFIDREACKAYADGATLALTNRIAEEGPAPPAAAVPGVKPPDRLTVMADGHPLALWAREVDMPRGVIVLLHGRTWSALPDFDLQVPGEQRSVMLTLNAQGYSAYALDMRGYGKTPRDATGWWTPDRAAQDVRATLEWLAREKKVARPTLVGWSNGSLVAQLAAQRYPQLISNLVLYGYPRNLVSPAPLDKVPATPAREKNTRERAASDFISPAVTPQKVIEAYVAAALSADPVRTDFRSLEQWNELEAVKVVTPTLVIHGERDPYTPMAAQAALFTGLGTADRQWVVLAGADHAALLENSQPAFVAAILAFVNRPKY